MIEHGTVLRIESSFPAGDWVDKYVVAAVRTAQKDERFSQWSNLIRIAIVNPPQTPILKAESDPKGIKLTIQPAQKDIEFHVLRQGPNDPQPVQAGIAKGTEFVDTGADYSVKYRYTAIAVSTVEHANAESSVSAPFEITATDRFPPSPPLNVTALASTNSIEVSWERSPEPDTKGYFVYRSVDGGAFVKLKDMAAIPAFSDKDVQPGKKYRYQVSAIDVRNNESKPSNSVEAAL